MDNSIESGRIENGGYKTTTPYQPILIQPIGRK